MISTSRKDFSGGETRTNKLSLSLSPKTELDETVEVPGTVSFSFKNLLPSCPLADK